MRTLQSKNGAFEKVGECLYRYSNGVYYGRIKIDGKDIKRSLKTTDRDFAKRKLAAFRDEQQQIDRSQGKLTLAELCDRYLKTVQHQKPKTIERKTYRTQNQYRQADRQVNSSSEHQAERCRSVAIAIPFRFCVPQSSYFVHQ